MVKRTAGAGTSHLSRIHVIDNHTYSPAKSKRARDVPRSDRHPRALLLRIRRHGPRAAHQAVGSPPSSLFILQGVAKAQRASAAHRRARRGTHLQSAARPRSCGSGPFPALQRPPSAPSLPPGRPRRSTTLTRIVGIGSGAAATVAPATLRRSPPLRSADVSSASARDHPGPVLRWPHQHGSRLDHGRCREKPAFGGLATWQVLFACLIIPALSSSSSRRRSPGLPVTQGAKEGRADPGQAVRRGRFRRPRPRLSPSPLTITGGAKLDRTDSVTGGAASVFMAWRSPHSAAHRHQRRLLLLELPVRRRPASSMASLHHRVQDRRRPVGIMLVDRVGHVQAHGGTLIVAGRWQWLRSRPHRRRLSPASPDSPSWHSWRSRLLCTFLLGFLRLVGPHLLHRHGRDVPNSIRGGATARLGAPKTNFWLFSLPRPHRLVAPPAPAGSTASASSPSADSSPRPAAPGEDMDKVVAQLQRPHPLDFNDERHCNDDACQDYSR